jgi:hypothetical protein
MQNLPRRTAVDEKIYLLPGDSVYAFFSSTAIVVLALMLLLLLLFLLVYMLLHLLFWRWCSDGLKYS